MFQKEVLRGEIFIGFEVWPEADCVSNLSRREMENWAKFKTGGYCEISLDN